MLVYQRGMKHNNSFGSKTVAKTVFLLKGVDTSKNNNRTLLMQEIGLTSP